ncbi:MAG: hypothetical protein CVV22_12525 [Ignavibacteriae bacterium HGW-Ignavibacteriae-1]|jgi:hypothetical protein|nr:MAG: hypothetical protein CVV22_12525 [Ignavibacteriae bacterium HGW-Ignavibacteriae-1]
MSITKVNKIIIATVIFMYLIAYTSEADSSFVKTDGDDFGISVELFGGLSYTLRNYNIKMKKLNISPAVRVMWNPNRRLNIGIETAYLIAGESDEDLTDTDLGKGKFNAKLEVVPVLIIFNMRVFQLDWTGGIGLNFMRSTIESKFKNEYLITVADNYYYCYMAGVGYSFDLSKKIDIGVETKIYSRTNANDFIVGAYFKFIYHFIF